MTGNDSVAASAPDAARTVASRRQRAAAIGDLAIGATLALLLAPGAVHAQAAETAPPPENEIVVTALRREAKLEDVPMAITAVSPDRLEQSGATSIHDLDRIVPGVKITFNGYATQPAIRGVTSLTNGNGFDNNVAIYVDGFYSPDMVSINGDLANIAGIEVLKGPQGTLYGRNTTVGVFVRNLTDNDNYQAYSGATFGDYGVFSPPRVYGARVSYRY